MGRQKRKKQRLTSPPARRGRLVAEEEKKRAGASPVVLIGGLLIAVVLMGGTIWGLMRSSPVSSESPANTSPQESTTFTAGGDSQRMNAATSGHDPYPLAVAENGAVRFPVSTLDDYQTRFYTYMHDGRPIEFLVLKTRDGVIRAAFSACELCFQSKLGFSVAGDEMLCNNCGKRFPSDQINETIGGCSPLPLQRTVVDNTLFIQVEDIIGGLEYFPQQTASQVITSPSERQRPTPTRSAAQTSASSDQVQRITVADAVALLDRGEGVLYDVRTTAAYQGKHAVGAVSFPEAELETLLDTLPADKALLFYCT
jgi:hypothetical protein